MDWQYHDDTLNDIARSTGAMGWVQSHEYPDGTVRLVGIVNGAVLRARLNPMPRCKTEVLVI